MHLVGATAYYLDCSPNSGILVGCSRTSQNGLFWVVQIFGLFWVVLGRSGLFPLLVVPSVMLVLFNLLKYWLPTINVAVLHKHIVL